MTVGVILKNTSEAVARLNVKKPLQKVVVVVVVSVFFFFFCAESQFFLLLLGASAYIRPSNTATFAVLKCSIMSIIGSCESVLAVTDTCASVVTPN